MAIDIFSLVKERCLLGNMNIRTEMHGDERESAVDLKFSFSSANNLLSKLHPDLRATFYKANDTRDLVNPDHMPHLRFPFLGAQSWDLEIPRTRLRVHDAEDATHDVVLGGGKTNKFKLVLKEGGTVEWEFRCQFSKPDEDAIAKLMRVLNQVVPISLECVDVEEEPDNFEKAEKLAVTPMSDARQAAEDMFAAPAADTPADDPDFKEVAKEETVSVEAVRAAENSGNVEPIEKAKKPRAAKKLAADALPDDDLDQAPVSNVAPIGRRTGGRKAAAGSNLE